LVSTLTVLYLVSGTVLLMMPYRPGALAVITAFPPLVETVPAGTPSRLTGVHREASTVDPVNPS
jgi:hypothetical protein